MGIITLVVLLAVFCMQVWLTIVIFRKRKITESEYYTDYVHKNTTLRVFKPEFEFQVLSQVKKTKILDSGTLSQFYLWILIEE